MGIEKIGGIVASEKHGLSSWMGETEKYWARFDTDPQAIPVGLLREHLIFATEYKEDVRPKDCIWIIAFVISKK